MIEKIVVKDTRLRRNYYDSEKQRFKEVEQI